MHLSHCVRVHASTQTKPCLPPPPPPTPTTTHLQLVCQHLPRDDLRCARLASSAWRSAASSTVRVVQHTPKCQIDAPLQEFVARVRQPSHMSHTSSASGGRCRLATAGLKDHSRCWQQTSSLQETSSETGGRSSGVW